jgi:hypothetical protein
LRARRRADFDRRHHPRPQPAADGAPHLTSSPTHTETPTAPPDRAAPIDQRFSGGK